MVPDGMHYGWISPATPRLLQKDSPIDMTVYQCEWVANFYLVGNFCGVLFSVIIFNHMSRKLCLFIACLPICSGWLGVLISRDITFLMISRWVAGVGRNMIYLAAPMYMGEVAEPKVRGLFGSLVYIMENSGILISYCFTPTLPMDVTPGIGLAITLLCMISIYFIPESPYYLSETGQPEKAKATLQRFLHRVDVDADFQRIQEAVEEHKSRENTARLVLKLFTLPVGTKALLIMLMLRSFQVFSGITVMTMNNHKIFSDVGGNLTPNTSAIIFVVLNMTGCVVCMLFADRYKRRALMMVSCCVCVVCLSWAGFYFLAKDHNLFDVSWITWFPLAAIVVFLFGYRIGLGTVPIISAGILFPAEVKVAGMAITDLAYSLANLCSNEIFHASEHAVGMFLPFFIFAGITALGALLVYLFLPETKNKNLEEIQTMLAKR